MLRDKALRIHESSPLRHSATFSSGDRQLQRRSTSSDSEGVFGNSSPTCFSMLQDKASSSLQELASKKSTSHQGVHQARQTNSSTVLLAQNLRRLTPSPAMLRDKALRIHESSPLRHSATFSSGDRQLQRRSTSSDSEGVLGIPHPHASAWFRTKHRLPCKILQARKAQVTKVFIKPAKPTAQPCC